jgi:hypothetical protein
MKGGIWVKLMTNINSDRRIRKAGPFALQAYCAILRMAKDRGDGGFVPSDDCDGSELAYWENLRGYESELERARAQLVETGALIEVDDGYVVAAWDKHNRKDPTAVERKRRQRAKSKADDTEQRDVTGVTVSRRDSVTSRVSRRDVRDVTQTDRQTERETERKNAPKPPQGGVEALEHFNATMGTRKKAGAELAQGLLKSGVSLEDIKLVTEWIRHSRHDRAKLLRGENDQNRTYGLKTIWRKSNFGEYLDFAREWQDKRGQNGQRSNGQARRKGSSLYEYEGKLWPMWTDGTLRDPSDESQVIAQWDDSRCEWVRA